MARPRTFERSDVLERAMTAFWSRGYEATSVDDLVGATGLGRQSMYNAFGSKHALYLATLRHYEERLGARMLAALEGAADTKDAFRRLFDLVMADAADPEMRPGCMMVNAATERAARDPAVRRLTRAAEAAKERAFAARIRAAQERGEIAPEKDPEALAKVLYNAVLGLRVRATRGPSKEELEPIVAVTLSLLD